MICTKCALDNKPSKRIFQLEKKTCFELLISSQLLEEEKSKLYLYCRLLLFTVVRRWFKWVNIPKELEECIRGEDYKRLFLENDLGCFMTRYNDKIAHSCVAFPAFAQFIVKFRPLVKKYMIDTLDKSKWMVDVIQLTVCWIN